MHKAGESIRSVEDVAQSLFKPLTLYLLCARVKPFFAVRWRGWRSAFDGSWGRACGLVDGAHNIIAARKGWDGLARAHSQVATRLGPSDLQGGSCGLPLFDCSYGQVCRAGVAAPAFRASQSIEGTIWFSHIFNRLSLHCSVCEHSVVCERLCKLPFVLSITAVMRADRKARHENNSPNVTVCPNGASVSTLVHTDLFF